MTLYELLTGTFPFESETYPALISSIAADVPVPLRMFRPDVPTELESIVMRCLEKEPSDRFETVRALAQALSPFTPSDIAARISQMTSEVRAQRTRPPARSTPAETARANSKRPRRRRSYAGLVAALSAGALAGFLGVTGWWLLGSPKVATAAASTGVAHTTTPPPGPSVALPAASPEPAPAPSLFTVSVRLAAEPPTAKLLLDGANLPSNPFVAELAPDGRLHQFVATHAGYVTERQTLAFDKPTDIRVRLQPVSRRAPSAAPQAPQKSGVGDNLAPRSQRSSSIITANPYSR
jgi:serine/threonine-protein kinase